MKLFVPVFLLFLNACSTLPDTIKTAPSQDLQLQQVTENLSAYIGDSVRWGGKIVEISNNDFSTLQLVQFPLNRFGRPILSKDSQGRFLVKSTAFLDPEIYKKDTRITVFGIVDSQQIRKVDEKTLELPLIKMTESHRWLDKQAFDRRFYTGFNYPHGYGYIYPYWYYHNYHLRHFWHHHHAW